MNVSEAARGLRRRAYNCEMCAKSYAYRFDLKNHIARSPSCQPVRVKMPADLQFTALPPAPFGTKEFFRFCEDVPLNATFDIAEWDGKVDHHIPKFRNLVRQQIPLVWKNAVNWCEGLKVPSLSNSSFPDFVDNLLKPENLQFADLGLEAKSAKLGEVTYSTIDLICFVNYSTYFPMLKL